MSSEGEHVVWQIGNTPIRLHYTVALDLSQEMRTVAALIKEQQGGAMTTRSLGVLRDASPRRPSRLLTNTPRPNRGIIVRDPEVHKFVVFADGSLVAVSVRPHTLHLPFEAALTISQWLRVRAKESRNRAGDTRHWSEISAAEN